MVREFICPTLYTRDGARLPCTTNSSIPWTWLLLGRGTQFLCWLWTCMPYLAWLFFVPVINLPNSFCGYCCNENELGQRPDLQWASRRVDSLAGESQTAWKDKAGFNTASHILLLSEDLSVDNRAGWLVDWWTLAWGYFLCVRFHFSCLAASPLCCGGLTAV